jgi:hypothetical protein
MHRHWWTFSEAEGYEDLVAFLSSVRASYITKITINLDGEHCPVLYSAIGWTDQVV